MRTLPYGRGSVSEERYIMSEEIFEWDAEKALVRGRRAEKHEQDHYYLENST